ncbi:MAG: translation elongation factor Ts [Pseudomonadota bacterium]
MQISASLVKELRERTGAGMMECKKALTETGGNIDEAVEFLRKSGAAAAEKKSSRVAAEGLVAMSVAEDGASGAMVEVNCETDFVAKEADFREFAEQVAAVCLSAKPGDVNALNAATLPSGSTVEERRMALVAKIGENLSVRRFRLHEATGGLVGSYSHGGRIGVLVAMTSGDAATAKDVAMHVAASDPMCVAEADLPGAVVEKERAILVAQAADSGKPAEIIEKMVSGRLSKFVRERTLLGQPFVKDPDQTVEKFLKQAGGAVSGFTRFEVGEGIEKAEDNFVDEVMQQAGMAPKD